jgi:hypothetical protein
MRRRRRPPTVEDNFVSVAKRLGIDAGEPPFSHREMAELKNLIFNKLIEQQPEFKFRPRRLGRPPGSRNKILAETDNKETLRKRRSRSRMQDILRNGQDILRDGLLYDIPMPGGGTFSIKVEFVKPTQRDDPDPPILLRRDKN